jgi:hypothetical protein
VHVATHFLAGWLVGVAPAQLSPRERGLIAFAGVAPDLDGLVVRWEREIPSPGSKGTKFVINLTDVRVGAPPGLFAPPP